MRIVFAWFSIIGAVLSFAYAVYVMFFKKQDAESLDATLRKMSTGGVPRRVGESSRLLEREPVMTRPTESDPEPYQDDEDEGEEYNESEDISEVSPAYEDEDDYDEEDDDESGEGEDEFEEVAEEEEDTSSAAAAAFGMGVPLGQRESAPAIPAEEPEEIEDAEEAESDDEQGGVIDFPPAPEEDPEHTEDFDILAESAKGDAPAADTDEEEHEIIDFPPPPAAETAEMPPQKGKTEEVDLMQKTDYSEYEEQWADVGPASEGNGADTDSASEEANDFFAGLDEDLESSYNERQHLSDFESEGEVPGPGDETRDSDTDDGTDRHENVRELHAGEYLKKGIDPFNNAEPPSSEPDEDDEHHIKPSPADISQTFHRLEEKADTEQHTKEEGEKDTDSDGKEGDGTLFG